MMRCPVKRVSMRTGDPDVLRLHFRIYNCPSGRLPAASRLRQSTIHDYIARFEKVRSRMAELPDDFDEAGLQQASVRRFAKTAACPGPQTAA